ncbi:hypothetical protein HIM_07128 [Hirsutella minnesotensis 3608]|uniref:Uncharacterized protein n=1 Tax=Hirsutella minnesotensis 3608 TaxID=1043627 RepID=A0A0F7ZZ43_9HYPO|nr:hypothetical protein HIM_07128 [Hirsutella minnesotensis 3608]
MASAEIATLRHTPARAYYRMAPTRALPPLPRERRPAAAFLDRAADSPPPPPPSSSSSSSASPSSSSSSGHRASRGVHAALVRLHLFAARLAMDELQDRAMDAVQALYLRRDWDVTPGLLVFLYERCDARPAARIRRWAVAMVAFSLAGAGISDSAAAIALASSSSSSSLSAAAVAAAELPSSSRARIAAFGSLAKNPQLRITANSLRNDQRIFGFRECSFHSHRSAVGQARCPHAVGAASGG